VTRDLQATVNALVTCLGRQADELRVLLELHARKQGSIRAGGSAASPRFATAILDTVEASARLEQERRDLTERLGNAGIDASIRSEYPDIARLIEVSRTSRLALLHDQLYRLWADLEERRGINSALVERSTRAARDTLRWIARTIPSCTWNTTPAEADNRASGPQGPA
jgi:hypothetical protein